MAGEPVIQVARDAMVDQEHTVDVAQNRTLVWKEMVTVTMIDNAREVWCVESGIVVDPLTLHITTVA